MSSPCRSAGLSLPESRAARCPPGGDPRAAVTVVCAGGGLLLPRHQLGRITLVARTHAKYSCAKTVSIKNHPNGVILGKSGTLCGIFLWMLMDGTSWSCKEKWLNTQHKPSAEVTRPCNASVRSCCGFAVGTLGHRRIRGQEGPGQLAGM